MEILLSECISVSKDQPSISTICPARESFLEMTFMVGSPGHQWGVVCVDYLTVNVTTRHSFYEEEVNFPGGDLWAPSVLKAWALTVLASCQGNRGSRHLRSNVKLLF